MFRGVFRAEALVHVGNHGLEQFLIDIALTHDVAACDHTSVCRHDARVGFDKFRQSFDGADAAAQPCAVEVVQDRPFFSGNNSAGGQHIQSGKVDIEIAVGVRCRQVAVIDLAVRRTSANRPCASSCSAARIRAAAHGGLRK